MILPAAAPIPPGINVLNVICPGRPRRPRVEDEYLKLQFALTWPELGPPKIHFPQFVSKGWSDPFTEHFLQTGLKYGISQSHI
jgi:hypothetical protein